MSKFPSLYNDSIIDIAKSAANAYVSTNETMQKANVEDFLNIYLDTFALAYTKVEQRVNNRDKNLENFDDCELNINKVL